MSPIFEDGSMISFPIPSKDKDQFSDLQYNGISYSDILSDLNYKGGPFCHMDPDLDQARRNNKIDGWFPAFGQSEAAASYLKNIDIQKDDLFLCFGNFHFVKCVKGHFKYVNKTGDFYKDNPLDQEKIWWHPHSSEEKRSINTNLIFKVSNHLSFDKKRPGTGLLSFDN